MEHVPRLPHVLDHVDDVEYHRDVHAVGGGARFHQVELRLGPVDEHDPALGVLGVLALRFQRRLRDHLPRLPFETRPDPFRHRAGPHGPGLVPRLSGHQALQEVLRAPHERRGRVDGGHRRHALRVLLLSRLEAMEPGERLPVPPAPLCRLPRRLAQVLAMQHHALAVEGQHDHRPLGRRLAIRRTARLVEGVEVLSRPNHQLFRLTLGHLRPGAARQVEQRFVEGPRGGRRRHPPPHLERVTLPRQVERGIERMQTLVTSPRVAHPLDLHRAEDRFQVAFVHAALRALDTVGPLDRTRGLPRAALIEVPLQELAHQLLAPPVQLPFEVALAHLLGFARSRGTLWPRRRPPRPPHTAPSRVERRGG